MESDAVVPEGVGRERRLWALTPEIPVCPLVNRSSSRKDKTSLKTPTGV